MDTYLYIATVDGFPRVVEFTADAEDWGHEPSDGEDAVLNLATAQLLIDNEYDVYQRFYKGADSHDYDADRKDAALYIRSEDGWEIIEAD